jgi:hypothetical protein
MPAWPMRLIALALFAILAQAAMAQTPAPQATAAQTTAPAANQQPLSAAQLEQLVAPIALYPDPLLAQMLIAATYPLEVVQADRWAKANKNLKGDARTTALAKESWDDSVKSLVAVPDVLVMMNDKLDWTQKLGDAMLAQQPDLMDAVQRLRQKAKANNKLETTKQQTVSTQSEGGKEYITIQPASDSEIYVPYYEPSVVYGAWPYPEYPPYYFAPPYGYVPGAGIWFAVARPPPRLAGRSGAGGIGAAITSITTIARPRTSIDGSITSIIVTACVTTAMRCARGTRRTTSRAVARHGRIFAARTASRYSIRIAATVPARVIVPAPATLQAAVIGQAPAIVLALVIGPRPATARRPVRARAATREIVPGLSLRRATRRSSGKALVRPRDSSPVADNRAIAVAVEAHSAQRAAGAVAALAAAAGAGAPMSRSRRTSCCSGISTTAWGTIASATTMAARPMSA